MKSRKTVNLVLCALFVALISVGAFIRIPIPMIPITLQFMFTMLAGLLLGGKLGAVSVSVYILIGLAGLPVFTQGGGIGYVLQPSFGYIIGFAVGAFLTGEIANKRRNPGFVRLLAANFAGLLIVYAFGMIYYYFISKLYLGSPVGLWPLFLYCFLVPVPGDIILCIVAAVLAKRLIPVLNTKRTIKND